MSQQQEVRKISIPNGQIDAMQIQREEVAIDKTEEENHDCIVDRLLKQMEEEYEHVQSFNDKSYSALQADKSNNEEAQNNENEALEGYQRLGSLNGGALSDSEDEGTEEGQYEIEKLNSNPESQELIEVGPVPESVFDVPERDFDIDADKIKRFALQMDISVPEWAKDKEVCEQRLRQLFEVKKREC